MHGQTYIMATTNIDYASKRITRNICTNGVEVFNIFWLVLKFDIFSSINYVIPNYKLYPNCLLIRWNSYQPF